MEEMEGEGGSKKEERQRGGKGRDGRMERETDRETGRMGIKY